MKLSAAIFESVESEFKADAQKTHGDGKSHHEDDCMGCVFLDMVRKDPQLNKLFVDFMGKAMLSINPAQALLDPHDFFGQLTGVFLFAMLVGRRQMLHELQDEKTSV